MLEKLLQLDIWEYLTIGSALVWLLFLILWILSQRKVKEVSTTLLSMNPALKDGECFGRGFEPLPNSAVNNPALKDRVSET